jgi:16S rRNA (uracil1498-N3)-methyltransferase
VERGDRAPVAAFFVEELNIGGGDVSLGAPAAHHASVRRLSEGDAVRVTDGRGALGWGAIRRLKKGELVVELRGAEMVPAPPLLEVLVPVADRERMLWLAEKCAELAVTVWQPVVFARSRSVVPRGEGDAFATKVRTRMVAALEQSGGSWLPQIRRELSLDAAIAEVRARTRYVLDRSGQRLDPAEAPDGVAVTFGPEGGIQPDEHALLRAEGWSRATLSTTTLRFETAGIAAVAILRAGTYKAHAEE